MKKISSFILLTMLCVFITHAQKTNNDNIGQYSYVQLPLKPLPSEYKSFLIEVKSSEDDPYRRDYISTRLGIEKYEKKTSGSHEFMLYVEEYPFTVVKRDDKTKEETQKVDGVEKKVTYYYYAYEVAYKLTYRMMDVNGEEMDAGTIDLGGNFQTQQETTRNYATYSNQLKKQQTDQLAAGVQKLNDILNSNFGYPVQKHYLQIQAVKAKKLNYDDFQSAYDKIMEATKIVFADENKTAEFMESCQPAIETLTKMLGESNVEDKNARVNKDVTCAIHYNLALICTLGKEYDKAIEHLNNALSIRKGFMTAADLMDFTVDRKKRAEANKLP